MSLEDYGESLTAKITEICATGYASNEFLSDGIDLRARAPNAIDWIVGEGFLNQPSLFQYRRQYQIVRDFFQLRCPLCNRGSVDAWERTPAQLEGEIRLVYVPAQSLDACPKCGLTRPEMEEEGLLFRYDTMIGVAGMRSGKSVIAAMIGTYLRHLAITIGIPERGRLHKMFGILPTQNLELAFVASTQTQSNETIWANFSKQCSSSPWFRAYVRWVKAKEAAQTTPKGQRRWRFEEQVEFFHDDWTGLNCASLNSNSGGMAGRTRLGFFIDELSRFGLGESKLSADEVWAVFDHSLLTLRGARDTRKLQEGFFGSAFAISSPISIEDKTMRLLEMSKRVRTMYGWKYATWEFNPTLPRDCPAMEAEFEKNKVDAARDFGASPPNAASPLIDDPIRFWACIDSSATPSADFAHFTKTDLLGLIYQSGGLREARMDLDQPLYIFGDAGVNFDQFALVACSGRWQPAQAPLDQQSFRRIREAKHFGSWVPVEGLPIPEPDPATELSLVTYHEWSFRIIPRPGEPVWFESVLDIIRKLKTFRRIAHVAFDHWNSEATLQAISNMGVPTTKVALKVDDFTRFSQDAILSRVKLLPPGPDDGLSLDENGTLRMTKRPFELTAEGCTLYEVLRLERSKDLKTVGNPRKGLERGVDSDDLARSLIGAHRLVQESAGKIKQTDAMQERRARETGQDFQGMIARTTSVARGRGSYHK